MDLVQCAEYHEALFWERTPALTQPVSQGRAAENKHDTHANMTVFQVVIRIKIEQYKGMEDNVRRCCSDRMLC